MCGELFHFSAVRRRPDDDINSWAAAAAAAESKVHWQPADMHVIPGSDSF